MTNCWAKALGGCSEKISREHIISDAMFPGPIVRVKGLSWCPDEFKEIGVANFAKKVLCEQHNNSLSDVDQAGVAAVKVFRDEVQIHNARNAMKSIRWTIRRFEIDGLGLERWCLKTLINVAAEGEYRIGRDSDAVGQPSARLVRVAFGKENFRPRAGLYGLGRVGEKLQISDGFRVIPYVDRENILVGGLFGIHGYRFLMYVEEDGVRDTISMPDLDSGLDYENQTLYPLRRLDFKIGKHLSHVFEFVYPE